tara:strand:+ start:1174 stop:2628 length:1455 start_codon:yes stop_codon:yes gene_type:complete
MVDLNIVVSVNENFAIGKDNQLLIQSKEDLKNFYKLTTKLYPEGNENILIMGYNTWISIPGKNRPLKKRYNLIITSNHKDKIEESEYVKTFNDIDSCIEWCNLNQYGRVFVIGGESIYQQCYRKYNHLIKTVFMAKFLKQYGIAGPEYKRFDCSILKDMDIIHTEKYNSECSVYSSEDYYDKKIDIENIIFCKHDMINKGEQQYLHLLKKIMNEGVHEETRNGTTISLFGEKMEFNMDDGFPLLTTKKMGYKTILRELLWFIQGSTSNNELVDKNVHIWSQNSTREFLDSRGLSYEEGDLGPVYGFQWRHSGAEYVDCHTDYTGQGIDQLKNVIHLIQTEPNSRRIIMNAWNPSDLDKMALPPCHVMSQFHVDTINNTLNCQLYQRSGDMFLGVPFNIASYSFLLHIIANITGYKPGKLIHILGDTHIYEDHLDAVNEQLSRVPVQFPELEISGGLTDIDSLEESMFSINNYKSYGKITAPMIA